MLKIKSKPGKPIVLDCSNYPEPDENTWHIFIWLLERSVFSETLERCGWDPLTNLLTKTAKEQSRFVNMIPFLDRADMCLKALNYKQ